MDSSFKRLLLIFVIVASLTSIYLGFMISTFCSFIDILGG